MTLVQLVAAAFLAISIIALIAQTIALTRVLRRHVPPPRRRGLLRTVACRVTAAGLYVGLGIATLFISSVAAVIAGFVVYSATQLMWLANSYADLRLARITTPRVTARHRAPTGPPHPAP